jgi:hypothetical protein
MLKNEDEFVRCKLLQEAAGKFSFPNKDFVKEDKLRMVVGCYEQYTGMAFFVALNQIYDWKFEQN